MANNSNGVDANKTQSHKSYATSNSMDIRPVKVGEISNETLTNRKTGKNRNYQYNGSHPTPRTNKIDSKNHRLLFVSHQKNNSFKSNNEGDNIIESNLNSTEENQIKPLNSENPVLENVQNDVQTSKFNQPANQALNQSQRRENPHINQPKHVTLTDLNNQGNGQGASNSALMNANYTHNKLTSFKKLGAVLVATMVLVTWVKVDKLAGYWHQSYDGSETLDNVAQSDIGKVGSAVDNMAKQNKLQENLGAISNSINTEANSVFYDEDNKITTVNKPHENTEISSAMSELFSSTTISSPTPPNKISIQQGQKAFFIGDSLMQGVAPWVMRELQKTHHIDSINLSKHSTGLTFAKFFDWPATVEKALNENPDITAMFVFLGGNDGQSIIDPNTQRHVRFGRERWDEIYAENINKVLKLAKQKDVQVLWLTPPSMKMKSLNKKMNHLDKLYHREVVKQGIVISSNEVLQLDTKTGKYSDSITVDGKRIKVRTADGVHFTTKGQKYIAKAVMDKIHVAPVVSTNTP